MPCDEVLRYTSNDGCHWQLICQCSVPTFGEDRTGGPAASGTLSWAKSAARSALVWLVLLLVAGCTGSADIRFVSLDAKEIDPPPTTVFPFAAQECYWWIDAAGELNIAMRCRQRSLLLGKYGHVDFDMSLVLGDPPAGSGRNYKIGRRETRTFFLSAFHAQRLTSYSGIVGVTVKDDGTLRGSFRIWMKPQAELQMLSFFPQRPGPLLCFGTFEAVEDAPSGLKIRGHCESKGGKRSPRTDSPPTTRPALSEDRPTAR
ncbi:MAG: hypothetical protein ABII12_02815 [Planctomycetota bacterium]